MTANRYIFKWCLNCSQSTAGSCKWSGSEFETVGPATENARVPKVLRRTRRTDSWWHWHLADRRCCWWQGTSETGTQPGLRYKYGMSPQVADFLSIFARSTSTLHLAKKVINTNRKSTMSFPMSLRWSSYVAPKLRKWGLKTAKLSFSVYNRTSFEESKVCYKVSLCEKCQRQYCKAFIGLTIRANMIGERRPLKRKFCSK